MRGKKTGHQTRHAEKYVSRTQHIRTTLRESVREPFFFQSTVHVYPCREITVCPNAFQKNHNATRTRIHGNSSKTELSLSFFFHSAADVPFIFIFLLTDHVLRLHGIQKVMLRGITTTRVNSKILNTNIFYSYSTNIERLKM